MTTTIADETTIAVPEAAFTLGFHEMTPNEMAWKQKAMLAERPKATFAGLEKGKVYCYKHCGDSHGIYVVEKITPSGKQADFRRYGEATIRRDYAGSMYGDFIELDDLMISFLGVTHEAIVSEAVSRGLDVPPGVRRYHPHLFIDIPERFQGARAGKPDEKNHPGARVKDALSYSFAGPMDDDRVRSILEQAPKRLGDFLDYGLAEEALNPGVASYYANAAEDFHDTIAFYAWLLPHVSPGGVFHVENKRGRD